MDIIAYLDLTSVKLIGVDNVPDFADKNMQTGQLGHLLQLKMNKLDQIEKCRLD